MVLSFLYREMTRRVANSKVNYVFAASLVKKFELVKCCYTSPPLSHYRATACMLLPSLISQECKAVNDPQT